RHARRSASRGGGHGRAKDARRAARSALRRVVEGAGDVDHAGYVVARRPRAPRGRRRRPEACLWWAGASRGTGEPAHLGRRPWDERDEDRALAVKLLQLLARDLRRRLAEDDHAEHLVDRDVALVHSPDEPAVV